MIGELESLTARARALAGRGERAILGIAGAPGGGKSTLAAALVAELGEAAVLVPMDGFHLAQAELVRQGIRDRMGAPHTFDVARLRGAARGGCGRADETVYAPAFRREIEEPIAGAIAVPPEVPLVVTEGNYLLLRDEVVRRCSTRPGTSRWTRPRGSSG